MSSFSGGTIDPSVSERTEDVTSDSFPSAVYEQILDKIDHLIGMTDSDVLRDALDRFQLQLEYWQDDINPDQECSAEYLARPFVSEVVQTAFHDILLYLAQIDVKLFEQRQDVEGTDDGTTIPSIRLKDPSEPLNRTSSFDSLEDSSDPQPDGLYLPGELLGDVETGGQKTSQRSDEGLEHVVLSLNPSSRFSTPPEYLGTTNIEAECIHILQKCDNPFESLMEVANGVSILENPIEHRQPWTELPLLPLQHGELAPAGLDPITCIDSDTTILDQEQPLLPDRDEQSAVHERMVATPEQSQDSELRGSEPLQEASPDGSWKDAALRLLLNLREFADFMVAPPQRFREDTLLRLLAAVPLLVLLPSGIMLTRRLLELPRDMLEPLPTVYKLCLASFMLLSITNMQLLFTWRPSLAAPICSYIGWTTSPGDEARPSPRADGLPLNVTAIMKWYYSRITRITRNAIKLFALSLREILMTRVVPALVAYFLVLTWFLNASKSMILATEDDEVVWNWLLLWCWAVWMTWFVVAHCIRLRQASMCADLKTKPLPSQTYLIYVGVWSMFNIALYLLYVSAGPYLNLTPTYGDFFILYTPLSLTVGAVFYSLDPV